MIQGCFQAGDAAADNQRCRRDIHLALLQRFQQGGFGHGAGYQLFGLFGANVAIGVDPRNLFPDIGHLKVVWIDAYLFDRRCER